MVTEAYFKGSVAQTFQTALSFEECFCTLSVRTLSSLLFFSAAHCVLGAKATREVNLLDNYNQMHERANFTQLQNFMGVFVFAVISSVQCLL